MSLNDTQLWCRLEGYIIKESITLDRTDGPVILIRAEKDISINEYGSNDKNINFANCAMFLYLISIDGHTSYVAEKLYNFFKEYIVTEKKSLEAQAQSQIQCRPNKKRKRNTTIIRED